MQKFLVAVGAALLLVGSATAASASSTIPWEGNGADNLPCETGGHWVLAPSFGIESAVLTVNGVSYTMLQNGQNGSWSADSAGPISSEVSASVTYEGSGDERDHLQLSHCTEGETSSPTPTSTPSPSPSDSPSPSPSESSSSSTPPPSPSDTSTPSHTKGTSTSSTSNRPSPLALTGLTSEQRAGGIAAVLLLGLGTGLAWLGRKTKEV